MSPPSNFSDTGLPKKKKYKLVANESKPLPSMENKTNSGVVPHGSKMTLVGKTNNELPKDRKDLLNFVCFLKLYFKENNVFWSVL